MKKIKISVLLLVCLLAFTECEKQLDLAPLGELTEDTFYQNERDFDAATLSAYNTFLNMYWEAYAGWGKMGLVLMQDDDMLPANNGSNQVEDFDWTNTNDHFSYLWGEAYKGIQRANVILDRLPEANGFTNEANKARYEGEAKFIRAYWHFVLALNWENPPVIAQAIKSFEETMVSNSQPGEIWNLIISDLTDAKASLPLSYDEANVGRITWGAATTLLGKVYLHKAQLTNTPADYDQAIANLQEVVSSNQYSLVDNYGDNFHIDHENNSESIFEVQIESEGSGNNNQWLANDFGTPENQDVGSVMSGRVAFLRASCGPTGVCAFRPEDASLGEAVTSPSLMAAIEPDDPRRPYIFYLEGDDYIEGLTYDAEWSVTGSTPSKYVIGTPIIFPPISDTNNDRLLRYADVLLMLAEAKLLGNNDVEGAAALINEVRHRADPGETILVPRSDAVSADEMFEFLMHERRIELAFEGWRYYDLVRWHKAGLINIATDIDFGRGPANSNWQERHLVKPIPLRERDLNPNLVDPNYN